MSDPSTKEVRFDIPTDDLSVIDGYVQASGESRNSIMRKLLQDWTQRKLHESILVCRFARINPLDPDSGR